MKIALMQEPSNYVGRWPTAGMSVMGFELNVFKIRQYTYSNVSLHMQYTKEKDLWVMLITNPSYRKILSNIFFRILISGSMFLPPTTVAGATLYSVAVYGGLVLFSMFYSSSYSCQHGFMCLVGTL